MRPEIAEFLLTDSGRALIARAEGETQAGVDSVRLMLRLRKDEAADRVAAAMEVVEARHRGIAKFGDLARSMYFTAEALEMASSAGASTLHARRMVDAGVTHVVDLCGGIGADALAFARAGLRVDVVEIDPARAMFAEENARVAGFADRVTVRRSDAVEVTEELGSGNLECGMWNVGFRPGEWGVWFDPGRRVGGRRVGHPEDYQPPLSTIDGLRGLGLALIGVKLAPAVDHAVGRPYGASLEFVSDLGECKEALLWVDGRAGKVVATVIGKDGVWSMGETPLPPTPSPLQRKGGEEGEQETATGYLYEPDPAVIRAHLEQELARRIGASTIDPNIAYLIGPRLVETPFATAFEIVDRFAFHIKALNRALRERQVGRVVIKKRGFPQEPEQVRKQLKLDGDQEMTIVLTRVGKQHQVILCRRM